VPFEEKADVFHEGKGSSQKLERAANAPAKHKDTREKKTNRDTFIRVTGRKNRGVTGSQRMSREKNGTNDL